MTLINSSFKLLNLGDGRAGWIGMVGADLETGVGVEWMR